MRVCDVVHPDLLGLTDDLYAPHVECVPESSLPVIAKRPGDRPSSKPGALGPDIASGAGMMLHGLQ
jgi:hypothetical protein